MIDLIRFLLSVDADEMEPPTHIVILHDFYQDESADPAQFASEDADALFGEDDF